MVHDGQPAGLRAQLCRTVAAVTALALAAAGCGYQSHYVAPEDGRARVVWGSSNDPAIEMSGANIDGQCNTELSRVTDHTIPLRSPARVEVNTLYVSGGSGYWSPRYYGPPIIIVRPGYAPPFARPPVFGPRLYHPAPIPARPISIGSGGGLRTSGTPARGGGGGSGGGNLGSGKEVGAILVVLAVIAATVLPVVALGLAASTPESSSKSSSAIDMVNAYNDLARMDGTPCTPVPTLASPGFAPPQEQPQ